MKSEAAVLVIVALSLGALFFGLGITGYSVVNANLPLSLTFNGESTDFSLVSNLSCVSDIILEKEDYGIIKFSDSCMNVSGANFDRDIKIKDNYVSVSGFDSAAIVSLYNLSFENPGIVRDGDVCDDCHVLSYSNGELKFSVSGFGNYWAREKIEFSIMDSTNGSVNTGEIVDFFADYLSLGIPIKNASCNLIIGNMTRPMFFSSSGAYRTSYKFFEANDINYNISCEKSGFDSFSEKSFIEILYVPFCGDGVCDEENNESCDDCFLDCGECPCVPLWECDNWGNCSDGFEYRSCFDLNSCNISDNMPDFKRECLCENGILNDGEEGIDCGGKCIPCPSCFDDMMNQGEEGVDCGGPCDPCPSCNDGRRNQGEERIDCGGPCDPCPGCSDGIRNQGEEGIDCGGPCPVCPSCLDGIKNQGEEDIDCGGPCSPCASAYIEKPSGSIPFWIYLVSLIFIILGVVLAFVLRKGVSDSSPDDSWMVNYVSEGLSNGFHHQSLIDKLIESGWPEERVKLASDIAIGQRKEVLHSKYKDIVKGIDLSNLMNVRSLLAYYKDFEMVEVIKEEASKYPPHLKDAILGEIKKAS